MAKRSKTPSPALMQKRATEMAKILDAAQAVRSRMEGLCAQLRKDGIDPNLLEQRIREAQAAKQAAGGGGKPDPYAEAAAKA